MTDAGGFLPEDWIKDPERRREVRIPEEVVPRSGICNVRVETVGHAERRAARIVPVHVNPSLPIAGDESALETSLLTARYVSRCERVEVLRLGLEDAREWLRRVPLETAQLAIGDGHGGNPELRFSGVGEIDCVFVEEFPLGPGEESSLAALCEPATAEVLLDSLYRGEALWPVANAFAGDRAAFRPSQDPAETLAG